MTELTHEAKLSHAIRLQCETVMAWRAAIKPGYGTREQRAEMFDEILDLIEQYNLLTLGR